MTLQACVDDSGSDPKNFVFLLAGFVATPAQWAAFSEEWRDALRKPPRLDYFKHNEAMALKKQFDKKRGWTEHKRNDRMVSLAQVIKKHVRERFSVAIRHTDYRQYIHGIPVEKRMKTLENPYFLLFHEFMLIVAGVHSIAPEVHPCEFIFDDQGKVGKRAAAWWPQFRTSMQQAGTFDFSPYFTLSPPGFKTDIEFLPLQAADLYAGQLQLTMRSDKIIIPPTPALRILWPISGYHRVIDHKYLAPMRATFMRMAKNIDAKDPTKLKYILGRPSKKRPNK